MTRSPYPERLDRHDFVDVFGAVYEHSKWVAEAIYPSTTPGIDVMSMAEQMRSVVETASRELKLDLLRAHPDLAGRLSLAESSRTRRAPSRRVRGWTGAIEHLRNCVWRREFQELNAAYTDRFGFPFIFAVKGFHRTDILEAFRVRVTHPPGGGKNLRQQSNRSIGLRNCVWRL